MVGYFEDGQFGRVMVYARRGMRNVTVRWEGEHLKMVVSAGITLEEIKATLDRMRAKIYGLRRTTLLPQLPTFTQHMILDTVLWLTLRLDWLLPRQF